MVLGDPRHAHQRTQSFHFALPHRHSANTRPCCSSAQAPSSLSTSLHALKHSTGSERVDALGRRAVEVIICMITRDFSVISNDVTGVSLSLSLSLSQKSLTHNIGSASALPIIPSNAMSWKVPTKSNHWSVVMVEWKHAGEFERLKERWGGGGGGEYWKKSSVQSLLRHLCESANVNGWATNKLRPYWKPSSLIRSDPDPRLQATIEYHSSWLVALESTCRDTSQQQHGRTSSLPGSHGIGGTVAINRQFDITLIPAWYSLHSCVMHSRTAPLLTLGKFQLSTIAASKNDGSTFTSA